MRNRYPTNSREWWEEYFVEDWDAHGGGGQTRHFMERLLQELPAPERIFLHSTPLSILDWGCAFGEGVELLSRSFPYSKVTGLDFAARAIEQARRRHPAQSFVHSDANDIPAEYDVILTSNCLEHFENPLEIARSHLNSCRSLYVLLVPYDEFPLSEHHKTRFTESSFPDNLGRFKRICAKRIEVDSKYWNGEQLLVAYCSEPYVRERANFAKKAAEQEKWDQYYAALPLYGADDATESFGQELVDRMSELLPRGGRILEAGCGGGWQSLALARSGKFQVSLMDFSSEALSYARRLFERENLNADFIFGDVFTPGEAEFDLTFNAGVLEHYTLNEQALFLRGMASRSRQYVLALVPNRLCYWYWLWRLQKSISGEWPFGKEVPLADFAAAFEASGLQFLGQTFMGESWAVSFMEALDGISAEYKKQLLEITHSPLIPREQKSYLLAGLGAVSTPDSKIPPVWMLSPSPEQNQVATMQAALADALAIRIGEEQRLTKLTSELLEKNRTIESINIRIAESEQRAMESDRRTLESSRGALELEHASQELSRKLSEQRIEVDSLTALLTEHEEARSNQVAEHEKIVRSLSVRLAETQQTLNAFSTKEVERSRENAALASQLREKESALSSLSGQLAQKEREIQKITNTLGWRLLNAYGPIKYRYLLPIYRLLGLPPYRRESGTTQKHAAAAGTTRVADRPDAGDSHDLQPREPFEHVPAERLFDDFRQRLSAESHTYNVVCFPIIDWDFRFQRPQQLMSRFALDGHRVFYLAQSFRGSGKPYEIVEKLKNVYEVSLRGEALNVYADSLNDRSRDEIFKSLEALRRDFCLGATVAVVQLPFWWPLVNKTRAEFAWPIVYDCMDHHAGFSTNRPAMIEQESGLLSSADLVVASSSFLGTEAARNNPSVILIRNACEYEHFSKSTGGSGERPTIGYYGAIADWFDSDLVADLAERRPDWDFVLVGSTYSADMKRLSKLPNVALPGEKHYSTIPEWLGKFDVAIIPFKRIPLTEATNPVKAYEILASGKPLVSVPIPEMAALAPLVRLASTVEEFETEISAALTEKSEETVTQRRNFAKENTWEKRYEALAPAVRDSFARVSIIIVTYNSLELNRLCIESVFARTEWPNFEVIVVDNASSDGTAKYLRETEKTSPNLQVILNNTNMGFAPANNIGLERATGEYLVLLNNDTIVASGWLSALIRRLSADPMVGLVGPVTNAISNEARIDVGYQSVDEMASWAANYVSDHDGEAFEIEMLAMFCVAMKRALFEQVGPLDERFAIGMFEDDDYCRRIRALGYKLICARDSFVHHWQRASFRLLGEDEYLRVYHENRQKFETKWRDGHSSTQRVTSNNVLYRDQLDGVLERIRSSKGAVIFLPSIGWDIHLFQRPHHLARTFAANGYISIFDSSNSRDQVQGFKEIARNLFLFHGPQEILQEIPRPVLWTFPYNIDRKDGYPDGTPTVYDWIDDLEVFPYDRALLERNHRRGLRESTVVACVARLLHDQALASRQDAIYLPNGVEYDRFADSSQEIDDRDLADFRRDGKPIAGYYGALAEWFDYELLDEVAGLRPDWNFLLIGQALDDSIHRQTLQSRTNVKWIGPRPYESLPAYLRLFDAAMIPFKINRITEATSPLKLYEYMAGGKPIITTPMPECQAFSFVNIARDAHAFATALDKARKQGLDPEFCSQLRAIARQHSWAARIESVVHALEQSSAIIESSSRANSDPSPPAGSTKSYSHAREHESASNTMAAHALVSEAVPRGCFGTSVASKTISRVEPALTGAAARIAERFRHFRTPTNSGFFNALATHLAASEYDSCLPMYFEFAITCNQRGRDVAKLLGRQTDVRGKQYLDVGCAYGGFLVAFAEQGAQVTGIDIDEMLLGLARINLRDNNLEVPVILADAMRTEQLNQFRDRFDLITCNDVIEHVEDPQLLLSNLATILRSDGLAYFEIPNSHTPRHVMRDGHYQLFGITLLDYPEARDYYGLHAPGVPYGVRHYFNLDQYSQIFALAGMELEVLESNYQGIDLATALNEMKELREHSPAGLSSVPPSLQLKVEERLTSYLQDIERFPRSTEAERRDFLLRYAMGFWRVLGRKRRDAHDISAPAINTTPSATSTSRNQYKPIEEVLSRRGSCNVCGQKTNFYYSDPALYRESLVCGECGTTSRYRSIARGILRAVQELSGVEAQSIAELSFLPGPKSLNIYDTQAPFYFDAGAYPIPDLLARCGWLDVRTSLFRPRQRMGKVLGPKITNQNLEALTFPDNSFDIVITSDVMEHVRLDLRAHQEIRRVLKPGGIYIFTVPHLRDRRETYYRVAVIDPDDPTKDIYLAEREYHGDANSEDARALSYRAYGTDLDETLQWLGFTVDYSKTDFPRAGILNTELFYCRLAEE